MLFAIILSRGLVCWFSIKTIFLRYEILSKASGKLLAKIVFCSESAFFWTIFEFLQNWVNSYGERFLRGFCTRGNPLMRWSWMRERVLVYLTTHGYVRRVLRPPTAAYTAMQASWVSEVAYEMPRKDDGKRRSLYKGLLVIGPRGPGTAQWNVAQGSEGASNSI